MQPNRVKRRIMFIWLCLCCLENDALGRRMFNVCPSSGWIETVMSNMISNESNEDFCMKFWWVITCCLLVLLSGETIRCLIALADTNSIGVKLESSTQINEKTYLIEPKQMNEIAWWVYTIWALITRLAYQDDRYHMVLALLFDSACVQTVFQLNDTLSHISLAEFLLL